MLRSPRFSILNESAMHRLYFKRVPRRYKTGDPFSDRMRQGIDSLKDRATKATTDATSAETFQRASTAVQESSQRLYEASKPIASSLLEKGKDATASVMSKSSQVAKESVERAVDSAKKATVQTFSTATDAARGTVTSATSKIGSGIKSMASTATRPFTKIWKGFDWRKTTRWMWWWSLAAIGVYGVATTVPKELVRQVFRDKEEEDDG